MIKNYSIVVATELGIKEEQVGGEDGGSFVYDFPITDYEKDFNKLNRQRIVSSNAACRPYSMIKRRLLGVRFIELMPIPFYTKAVKSDINHMV